MGIETQIKDDLFWEHNTHSFGELPTRCSLCYEDDVYASSEKQEDYELEVYAPDGIEYNAGPDV